MSAGRPDEPAQFGLLGHDPRDYPAPVAAATYQHRENPVGEVRAVQMWPTRAHLLLVSNWALDHGFATIEPDRGSDRALVILIDHLTHRKVPIGVGDWLIYQHGAMEALPNAVFTRRYRAAAVDTRHVVARPRRSESATTQTYAFVYHTSNDPASVAVAAGSDVDSAYLLALRTLDGGDDTDIVAVRIGLLDDPHRGPLNLDRPGGIGYYQGTRAQVRNDLTAFVAAGRRMRDGVRARRIRHVATVVAIVLLAAAGALWASGHPRSAALTMLGAGAGSMLLATVANLVAASMTGVWVRAGFAVSQLACMATLWTAALRVDTAAATVLALVSVTVGVLAIWAGASSE